jgi:hypothetical protein
MADFRDLQRDTCVHQHIVSRLDSCLTNRVTCPEFGCRAIISLSVIHDILFNDCLRVYHWQGKSEKWIQLFTLRCPGSNLPIEKNGECFNVEFRKFMKSCTVST